MGSSWMLPDPEHSAWRGKTTCDRAVATGPEGATPDRDDIMGRALPRDLVEAARAEELRFMESWQ
eukprot:8788945-Alexandrium_andersonii.AAC.1